MAKGNQIPPAIYTLPANQIADMPITAFPFRGVRFFVYQASRMAINMLLKVVRYCTVGISHA
ncbi:hypothetical protein D3C76_1717320 [compost metagenome]